MNLRPPSLSYNFLNKFIMRVLFTFLLMLFCAFTLTTPITLAARMLPVLALVETAAHCQTGVNHSDLHLAYPDKSAKSADPAKTDAGDCADCSSCQICAYQCQPLLAASNAPQVASHTYSMPEPTLAGRVGITVAPELRPPRN